LVSTILKAIPYGEYGSELTEGRKETLLWVKQFSRKEDTFNKWEYLILGGCLIRVSSMQLHAFSKRKKWVEPLLWSAVRHIRVF